MNLKQVNQWGLDAIASLRLSDAEAWRQIARQVGGNPNDRSVIGKVTKGERSFGADEILAISVVTKRPLPVDDAPRGVPVIDSVMAGKLADSKSQIPPEDWPLLYFSDLGKGNFFALKVEGDSMDRVSPDGSIIIVNRADTQLITGRFYVFSIKGSSTYKMWHGGDNKFLKPFSTNPAHDPIPFDKRVEVVGRVKRTVLDL